MNAIVLGNGPSLLKFMPKTFNNDNMVFGVNRIYLAKPERVDYYVALDKQCWQEDIKAISALDCSRYFVWDHYIKETKGLKNVYGLNLLGVDNGFSLDYKNGVYHYGSSLVVCFQLACEFGAKKIIVYGLDCDCYNGEASHFYGARKIKPNIWAKLMNRINKIECPVPIVIYSDLFKSEKHEVINGRGD